MHWIRLVYINYFTMAPFSFPTLTLNMLQYAFTQLVLITVVVILRVFVNVQTVPPVEPVVDKKNDTSGKFHLPQFKDCRYSTKNI